MDFYKSIVEYYDFIFPHNTVQLDFVKHRLTNTKELSVLDVGCGTGNLCLELTPFFKKVTGIDPDQSMLASAKGKAVDSINKISFHPYGMLDIEKHFDNIDAILCFGNTLVHLNSEEEILAFLKQAKQVLRPGGKLLIQIINYDRIIDRDIRFLPTIENDQIKFVRNYYYLPETNSLDFETILTIKKDQQKILNTIQLYPLRRSELESLLYDAGFSRILFYGNFKRDPLKPDSIPLVLEAISH